MSNLQTAKMIRDDLSFDIFDTMEVLRNMETNDSDFEVDNHRFIHTNDIDEIQQDELSSDEYMLGCFNASFLAGILDIDQDVIESLQAIEAYENVGKMILSMGKLEELQEDYARLDGYGHHFNHYDGNEIEIGNYHIFRIN